MKKGSSWLATAVLCGIVLTLNLSYKLVLNKGLFLKPLKWRDPEGIAAHAQHHPCTCLRSSPWAGPQSPGEKTPVETGCLLFPSLRTAHSQRKFRLSQRPRSSEPQNWETKHTPRRSLNSQNWCCKGQTLMFMDLIHTRPLRPSLRAMTNLVIRSSVHCWSWETNYRS